MNAPEGDFIIDTGPELRLQLIEAKVRMVHAALFTHAHADHIMGLDDLRIFAYRLEKERLVAERKRSGRPELKSADVFPDGPPAIPLYCEDNVQQAIRETFQYAFTDPATHSHHFAAPRLRFESLQPGQPLQLMGADVLPIRLHHGKLPILGYRIGNVAFCTDVSTIPAESRQLLQDVDVLILDCLRDEPHPTHMSVDQAIRTARKLNAKRTVLTHMSHEIEYRTLLEQLPDGIEPGYDGLQIPIQSGASET